MSFKIWVQQTTFTIEWYFYRYTTSGYLSIDKNSINEVYVTSTTSGTLTVSLGDQIDIYVNAQDTGNSVAASINATNNGSTVCNPFDCASNTASVSCTGTFVVSGDGSIYGYADFC